MSKALFAIGREDEGVRSGPRSVPFRTCSLLRQRSRRFTPDDKQFRGLGTEDGVSHRDRVLYPTPVLRRRLSTPVATRVFGTAPGQDGNRYKESRSSRTVSESQGGPRRVTTTSEGRAVSSKNSRVCVFSSETFTLTVNRQKN